MDVGNKADWLYLDLNSFFASCEQQESPSLRGRPVAVVPMMTDSTSCLAASYEAKAYGIKTGTRVGDAKKMCPGLKLVLAHHQHYVKYHHAVIEAVESCIPVHSVCSIDEIACELTGTQKNLEVAQALAMKIKKTIYTKVGESLSCSIGLAPNTLLAKMAADMQKPNGLTALTQSNLHEKLCTLKLRDVPGIGPRMEARFFEQGIRTMEQLLVLNEMQMKAAWGSVVGVRYHRLLHGENMQYRFDSETKSMSHQHVLPPDQRNRQDALVVAQKLLSKAAIRLRKEGFMARFVGVYVRYQNEHKWKAERKIHETQDSSLLLKLLKELYQLSPKNEKPFKVSVVLADFIREEQHQLSFFENEKKNLVFKIADKINEKYGKDTVFVASLKEHLSSAPTRISFSRIPNLNEFDDDSNP